MTQFIKKKFIITSLLIISLLLAACGNQPSTSPDKENKENDQATQEERVMADSLGNEVTIPENPERIIAPYLEDPLIALGITPVAQWSVNDGASIQNYLQDSLKDIPTIPFDLPFEAVTSFNPDLILIGSPDLIEGGKYEQYSKIASTYVLGAEENNWRNKLLKIGEVFGQTDKANEVLATYDQLAKEAKGKIEGKVGKPSAAAIWIINNTVYMVSETASSGVVLYNDLGLQPPSLVQEISASATGDWSQVSLEKFVQLDADYLFVINGDQAGGAEILNDSLMANIPAIKNGNVYEFNSDTSWLYSGVIANTQIIEHVLASMVK